MFISEIFIFRSEGEVERHSSIFYLMNECASILVGCVVKVTAGGRTFGVVIMM